jgi:hypothetical protein
VREGLGDGAGLGNTPGMRHGWAAVAALLLVAACDSSSGAAASCVGPQLVSLSPDRGAAHAAVTLSVEWLHNGCNDTVYVGPNGPSPANEETPRMNVPVYFAQQSHETLVGTMSGTGAHYRGSISFAVPATARPGHATLLLGPERLDIASFTVGPP